MLDPDTLHRIDIYLEQFYPESVKAGAKMAAVDLGTTQIRGLETLITSTSRFSEIINYVKNQAGKDRKQKWSIVAPILLKQLDELETEAKTIGLEKPQNILEIKMKLARGWAKQVATHCIYEQTLKKEASHE